RWNCAAGHTFGPRARSRRFALCAKKRLRRESAESRRWPEARRESGRQTKRQDEKFETLHKKKSDISALPAFSETHETRAMFDQIDARAAYLEKLEAEVRDWEKQNAKASEANVRSRAAAIAKELADSHAGKESLVASIADGDGKL